MNPTPGQIRTAKATAARKRIKHERMAAELREAGYAVIPPREEIAQQVREALASLDGSAASVVSLLTGLTREDLAALGGVPERVVAPGHDHP